MKSYLSLAWKELKAQKITSVLMLIAVILSTVATTALGQSIGILQTMRIKQASGLNGDRYVTFHQLTEEQNHSLSSDPRLKDVGGLINIGSVELGNSGLSLYLREYHGNALDAYPSIHTIKSGRLPTENGEIALSEDTLKYLNFTGGCGDTIALTISVGLKNDDNPPFIYTADFVLTGILENNYLGYATGTVDGIIGEGTAKSLLPEKYYLYSVDFKTINTRQFQSVVYDLAEKLNISEVDIQYNWVLLNALGISYNEKIDTDADSGFPFMTAACILVGALILLAAGLVIYNILKVSVAKRIREYGTLRAIGCERKQLYMLVTIQLLILCGIGIPIGATLGVVSAKGILTAAASLLNPDLFMSENIQELNNTIDKINTGSLFPLIISISVTLLFTIFSAFPSARYASCISPVTAMNRQSVNIKRINRKQKKIRNFEAFYARLNLKRNRMRTAVTIISIVMSVTVFVALQSFTDVLDTSDEVRKTHIGDYAVTNETTGIEPESVLKFEEQEMTAGLSTSKLTVYSQDENGNLPVDLDFSLQSWESFQIAAIDDARLVDYVSGLSKEERKALETGTACIVKNPIPMSYEGRNIKCTELQKSDYITINGRKLQVIGIADEGISVNNEGYINGIQIIVTNSIYDILTGDSRYSEVYPTLSDNVDAADFENWLDNWCKENPGSHWLSYRQTDAQLSESFEQIKFLCWGLILFIGIIGILNIINTVYTNIHTRISEIGMQRAIGMSSNSLYKTFLWEGVYYGLIASLIGAVCGYICDVFIGAATSDSLQLVQIPIISILEATIVSVIACLAATAVPLCSIKKMSIVDSIENME